MASLYSSEHLALQERFGTQKLATLLDTQWVHETIADDEREFIQSRDMFFLSTVDPDGHPTVSYKGGPTGFVKVLDDKTVIVPGYDGNGMFLSLGNIDGQAKVGLLFIDFETPHRLRLQGTARIDFDSPHLAEYQEAKYIIEVSVTKVWVNCPRYIHTYRKVEQSRYVPATDRQTPLASWKRLDMVKDVLTPADQARAAQEGPLDIADYQARVARGEG